METIKYLKKPTPLSFGIPDETVNPFDYLMMRELTVSKKIDAFYRAKVKQEFIANKGEETDTIERWVISKFFSRKAQNMWMSAMLRIRDCEVWGTTPFERDVLVLDELFKNYGACIAAGTV